MLKGGGTNAGVRKERAQMNEKGVFHAGYGPPLDLPNTGSMSLQFGQPISLGKYAREHRRAAGEEKSSKEETSAMVNDLAYHIMDALHSTSVCHGTHLVASILVRSSTLFFFSFFWAIKHSKKIPK